MLYSKNYWGVAMDIELVCDEKIDLLKYLIAELLQRHWSLGKKKLLSTVIDYAMDIDKDASKPKYFKKNYIVYPNNIRTSIIPTDKQKRKYLKEFITINFKDPYKKLSQKELSTYRRQLLVQELIDSRRCEKPEAFVNDETSKNQKYRTINKWLEGKLKFIDRGVRKYDDKLIDMKVIAICCVCYDPVHRMKDDAIKCSNSHCNRSVHYKCAMMLPAYQRVNETIPRFECEKHYKGNVSILNEKTGIIYQYYQNNRLISKSRLICTVEVEKLITNRTETTGDWIEIKREPLGWWRYATLAQINANRLFMCECGRIESNEPPKILKFSDCDRKEITYYKEGVPSIDPNSDKGYEEIDIDTLRTPRLFTFRFRNSKCSNGVSVVYNFMNPNRFKSVQDAVIPLVDIHSPVFQKLFKTKSGAFHVDYHDLVQKVRNKKSKIKLTEKEILELIKRIKLHFGRGYNFGEAMRGSQLSQELWDSVLKNPSEVMEAVIMDYIYDAIHYWFTDFESSNYPNTQINNYLKGTVMIKGKKYSKTMGIDGHNDNPVTDQGEYKGVYHFDYPIYMICIQGSGVFNCGVHQQTTQYDKTQQYKTLPNSLIRFEGYSAWNALHNVQKGSIEQGDRIMMMIRPYHAQVLAAKQAAEARQVFQTRKPAKKRQRLNL